MPQPFEHHHMMHQMPYANMQPMPQMHQMQPMPQMQPMHQMPQMQQYCPPMPCDCAAQEELHRMYYEQIHMLESGQCGCNEPQPYSPQHGNSPWNLM